MTVNSSFVSLKTSIKVFRFFSGDNLPTYSIFPDDSKNEGIEKIKNEMISNFDNGGANLFIFDADQDSDTRFKEISEWQKSNGFDFEISLIDEPLQKGID